MDRIEQEPVSDGVTRVEFTLSNPEYPFVGASTIDGCRMVLEEMVPRTGGAYAEFFAVSGVDPAHVLELADAHGSVEATLLNEYDSGGLVEFHVDEDCPAVFLGEQGALPCEVYSAEGEGQISAEIPLSEDEGRIVEAFLKAHPDAELTGKNERDHVTPLLDHRRIEATLREQLTDRQAEVLTAAYEAGYYEWPREITADGLAKQLDISASTLLKHLRTAERKFVRTLFERPEQADGGGAGRS